MTEKKQRVCSQDKKTNERHESFIEATDQSVGNFTDSFILLNIVHPKSKRNFRQGNRVGNFRDSPKKLDVVYSLHYL